MSHSYQVLVTKMLEKQAWQCGGVIGVGIGLTLPLSGSYYGNAQYVVISKNNITDKDHKSNDSKNGKFRIRDL